MNTTNGSRVADRTSSRLWLRRLAVKQERGHRRCLRYNRAHGFDRPGRRGRAFSALETAARALQLP